MLSAVSTNARRRQSARELSTRMERMMRFLLRERVELSRTGMSVLGVLRDHGPCRITDLATRERVTQPSMTTLISRLEAQGLVERRSDDEDRRVVNVSLTNEGRALQKRVRAARAEALARRFEGLDDADLAALAAALPVLDRIIDHVPADDR
jgi:DNA-binding MarR family transcriptional regulator